MIKLRTRVIYLFVLSIVAFAIMSCQKELEAESSVPKQKPKQKPKLGTIWSYRLNTYRLSGGLDSSQLVTYKATREDVFNGKTWLKIVDIANDTLVYYLSEKTGGLYQYTNNDSYLLCKFPAMLNDTFHTYNEGYAEIFTVKGVNDSLVTNIGTLPVNYYEGMVSTYLIDQIKYNEYAWIVRRTKYKLFPLGPPAPGPARWKYYELYIVDIDY